MAKKVRKKLDIDRLLTKVVELFVRHNPHDLTYSDISRFTGVPRSTLYYYFGKNIDNLILESAQFSFRAFTQINSLGDYKKYDTWSDFQKARLLRAIKTVHRHPWGPELMIRYRKTPGEFGERIAALEARYFKGLAQAWEYFHNKPADPTSVRLCVYVRVGLLYGISQEKEFWNTKNMDDKLSPMVNKLNKTLTQLMKS